VAELYSDHDIGFDTVVALRALGHAVVTTRDIGQENATDDVQLLTAASNNWILVTHNRRDFLLLHRAWRNWAAALQLSLRHSGMLVIPQQTWLFAMEAAIVDRFIRTVPALANEMYICDRAGHWSSALMR
jgi:hypothetical protein